MPKIERKKHDVIPDKEEDIEIKSGRFRFYFQNRYTLIALTNDILTGIFYMIGSLTSITPIPDFYGTYFYLIGGFFLTARPILKIFHNVFIYDDEKLAKKEEQEAKEKEADEEENDPEEEQEYNEEYYGRDNNQEYEEKSNNLMKSK